LIVDANRELSGAVTFERLEPVTGQRRKIGQARRCLKPIEPQLGLAGKTRKLSDVPSRGKSFSYLVPVADDHSAIASTIYDLRK
jgi:hypothetical protein